MDSRSPLSKLCTKRKTRVKCLTIIQQEHRCVRRPHCDYIRVLPFPLPFPRPGPGSFSAGQERQRGARRFRHGAARCRAPGGLRAPLRAREVPWAPPPAAWPTGRVPSCFAWPTWTASRCPPATASTWTPMSSTCTSRPWSTSAPRSAVLPKRDSVPDAGRAELERTEQLDAEGVAQAVWETSAAPIVAGLDPEHVSGGQRDRALPNAHRTQDRRRSGRAPRVPHHLRTAARPHQHAALAVRRRRRWTSISRASASAPRGSSCAAAISSGSRSSARAAAPARSTRSEASPARRNTRAIWPNSCPGCAPRAGWAWAARRSGARATCGYCSKRSSSRQGASSQRKPHKENSSCLSSELCGLRETASLQPVRVNTSTTADTVSSAITTRIALRRAGVSHSIAVDAASVAISVCIQRRCTGPGRLRIALAISCRPRRSAIRMVAEFAPLVDFRSRVRKPGRHLIHRPVNLVRSAGRNQHRGGLEHPGRFLVDVAAMRTARFEFVDLLAAAAARHQATTRGGLGLLFRGPRFFPYIIQHNLDESQRRLG